MVLTVSELLGMADQGFRVMTTNVAVNARSDFAGLNITVRQSRQSGVA